MICRCHERTHRHGNFAGRRGHCSSVFAVPRLPIVAPASQGSRNGSGRPCQPAIGMRVCAKQTLANGLFNERERFFGFSCFGFSHLGAKLYGRQLILLASIHDWACSSALQAPCSLCSAVMMSSRCARSAASARISAIRSFSKALAQSDWARGLGLAGVLLHTAEDIRSLIHQIESCCAAVAY